MLFVLASNLLVCQMSPHALDIGTLLNFHTYSSQEQHSIPTSEAFFILEPCTMASSEGWLTGTSACVEILLIGCLVGH